MALPKGYRVDEFGGLVLPDDDTFCSGVNHHQEIVGLAMSGCHVGMVAKQITGQMWKELEISSWGMLRVFVDSGAFSEVEFTADGPRVVKEITDADWRERLEIYRRVAEMYGPRCWLVAPDQVGNQRATLARLETYAEEVKALRETGANIIVPFQRGDLSPLEFADVVTELLGFNDWWAGVPMKKAATSLEELAAIVDALPYLKERLHLLGISPSSPRFEDAMDTIKRHAPYAQVTSDAVRIRAMAGRSNGKGKGPRAITAARDRHAAAGVTGGELKRCAVQEVFTGIGKEMVAEAMAAGWRDPELYPETEPAQLELALDERRAA